MLWHDSQQNALNSGGATASNINNTVGSCNYAFVNAKRIYLSMFFMLICLHVFFVFENCATGSKYAV